MSIGPVRALSGRTVLLVLSLLLSVFAVPQFLGFGPVVGLAGAVLGQGDATACEAYGINWTSCTNAFASDDLYAYANASSGSSTIQRVATTTDSADANSWSFSHTVPAGSNRLLLLAVATDNGDAVAGTPQYGATSFGLIAGLLHSSGKPRLSLYGIIGPTVGTDLVTGNLAGNERYTVGAISYTGVHQTMPVDFPATTGEGSTGTTISITVPSQIGDLVVDFTADIGQEVPIVGAGQTELFNEEMGGPGTSDHRATSSEEPGAGSVVMSRSNKEDGKEWVSIGLNLNVALSSTGLKSPTATGEDHNQWVSFLPPTNAFASNDTYATELRNGRMQDYYNFTLGVPNGASISGVEVQVEGHDPDFSGNGVTVELSWNGGANYTSKALFLNFPDGADAGYQIVGGPTDPWGRSWTPDEFSDTNFRLRIEKGGSDWTWAYVDHLQLEVYYLPPSSANADTAWSGFGFALDPDDQVQVVEVGIEWWRNNTAPSLNVTISWDGGVTWAANQTATNKSADDDAVEWLDFSSATAWNASTLEDTNLRVRVGSDFAGSRLDYVTVRTTYNDAPEIANVRLQDSGGQSRAGGLLDPTTSYRFLFNVTDGDGWTDIGSGGAVGIRLWYDGNVTPELAWTQQTNGSDHRFELRYEDLADPGNATLDEWSVVEGNAQYNASASALTEIYSGPTLIGYEFDLWFRLSLSVKASSEPINGTAGGYNDPDSWNGEVLASDGSAGARESRAAGGEHLEFGVFALALMDYAASVSPTTIAPADNAVFRVDFGNTGQGAASSVWVNVTLPAELSYVGDDAAAIGGVRTCCESFEFTNVNPGSYSFNITASAGGGIANGTVVWTNFSYAALDAQGRPINQTAEDVSVTIVNAIMSLSASASPTTLGPGDTTVFRVDFTNGGQGDAQTVWVNVTLGADLTYVSDDAAAIGGVGSCCFVYVFSNVAPGIHTFNITAVANAGVADGATTTTNVTLEAVDPAGAPLTPSAESVNVTLFNGVLSYSVVPDDTTLNPGQATVFRVTFTNSGGGDAGVVYVNMTLAADLTYVSDDAASIGGVSLCCYDFRFVSVAPGTYLFNITVRANGGVPNGTVTVTNFTFEAQDPLGASLQSSAESESITIHNAEMALAVVVDPSSVGPGASTVFEITFSNTGAANASFVWVNVTLPAELVYVSDDAALIGGILSGTYSFAFTDVVPGDHTFNLTVSAVGGVPNGTIAWTNSGLEALDPSWTPLSSSEVDVPVTLLNALMTYAVVASPTGLEPGDTTTFTIWFNNSGSYLAERVWVNATLPGGLSYVSDTSASLGGTLTGTYSFEFSSVAPGSFAFDLVARLDGGVPDGAALVTNFTFETVDTLWQSFPTAYQDVMVDANNAILALSVTVDPSTVWPGAQTTFQITFTNSGGGQAAFVWVNVTLPPELSYVSDDAASIGGARSGSYDFEFVNVLPGSHTFNVTVAAPGGVADGTVVVTDVVMEGLDRAWTSLAGASREVPVNLANAVLDLTLASSASQAEPGDTLTFTATLANLGGAPGELLTIEGSVDANTTYVSSSPTGVYDAPGRLVRWTLASLAGGSQVFLAWTVTVTAGVQDGAIIFAAANVEGHDTAGVPLTPQQDSLSVGVNFGAIAPALVVTPTTAERADEIVATLFYNNTGSGAAGNTWLNWSLNGHYQLLALTPSVPFTSTASGFAVALSSVGAGAQRLDARLQVLRGLENNLVMDLDVSFAGSYRNGNSLGMADLTASVTLQAPEVELSLTTSANQIGAGSPLTLTVTIRNTGQAAATGWMNFTLPAGVSYQGDDGTFLVTESNGVVSWRIPSVGAGAEMTLSVTLLAERDVGLQPFRFGLEFTDGKGSPPTSIISNSVSVQIGAGAGAAPFPWLYLLLAALVGGIVLFALARRSKKTSIEEVFVVHENGILIAHRSKTLTPDKDEDVLAGMLSAVQNFIQDAFTEHEETPVRGLQFDKFNILVEQGTHHYVAVVFRGRDSGSLQARLHALSATIEMEFGAILAGWSGTARDVRPVKALLPLLWGKQSRREKKKPKEAVAPPPLEEPKPSITSLVDVAQGGITGPLIRVAKKGELRSWCVRLGLDDSGTVADLRRRLLRDLDERVGEAPTSPVAEFLAAEKAEVGSELQPDEVPPKDALREEPTVSETADQAELKELEEITEALEPEPEEVVSDVREAPPEVDDREAVAAPFVVLPDDEEPQGTRKEPKRKKGKKKSKRGKKGRKARDEAPTGSESEVPPVDSEPKPVAEETAEPEIEPTKEESGPTPAESSGPTLELTVKQIWDAPKGKLREWCQELGVDDKGPIMNLRLRLLSRIEPE